MTLKDKSKKHTSNLKRIFTYEVKYFGSKLANLGFGKISIFSKAYYLILDRARPDKSYVDFRENKILIDPNEYVGSRIYEGSFHEEELAGFIDKKVSKSNLIFDIGAHIGSITIIFRENVGQEGEIHAFEPNPESYEMMLDTVKQNEFTNIEMHHCAVSDSEGKVKISKNAGNTGKSSIKRDAEEVTEVDSIPAVKIFNQVEGTVDWLKIDIEGAELEVLQNLDHNDKLSQVSNIILELHPELLEESELKIIYEILESSGQLKNLNSEVIDSFSNLQNQLENDVRGFYWSNSLMES
jgi:FkbM family methyltransferase